jgi:hypothetical protein
MSIDPWTITPPPPPAPARRRAGYSLASLVQLVTASGVVLGVGAASIAPNPAAHMENALANAAFGMLVGIGLGGALAASYSLGARGVVSGLVLGPFVGAAAGALSGYDIHLPLALAGSVILVALGAGCRLLSARQGPARPGEGYAEPSADGVTRS